VTTPPDPELRLSVTSGRAREGGVGVVQQFRDREITVEPGEFIIVPHQTEHRPVADDEVHVLLLEPKSTVNTGTAGGDRTREVEWI
jgi:mannose-6-phosphate isomerase-like protein (cupin superfamily)